MTAHKLSDARTLARARGREMGSSRMNFNSNDDKISARCASSLAAAAAADDCLDLLVLIAFIIRYGRMDA